MNEIQDIVPTYYKYDCPNKIHVFVILNETETCIYCWVEDNPPNTANITQ